MNSFEDSRAFESFNASKIADGSHLESVSHGALVPQVLKSLGAPKLNVLEGYEWQKVRLISFEAAFCYNDEPCITLLDVRLPSNNVRIHTIPDHPFLVLHGNMSARGHEYRR